VLCVGKLRVRGIDRAAMERAEVRHCVRHSVFDGVEQIARLVFQLIEIRSDRKMASGHNEPP
jgi:hypothetical protein